MNLKILLMSGLSIKIRFNSVSYEFVLWITYIGELT